MVLLDVISVKTRPEYFLEIVFENNQKRIFDMSLLIERKPFSALKDYGLFSKARVDYGTVVWPNNIDIDPEVLWENSVQA